MQQAVILTRGWLEVLDRDAMDRVKTTGKILQHHAWMQQHGGKLVRALQQTMPVPEFLEILI